jgi:hypothetical protein
MSSNTVVGVARLRSHRWWALAAVLLLIGSVCLVLGLRGHQHPLAGPVGSHMAAPNPTTRPAPIGGTTTLPPPSVPAFAVRSTPVELHIPAIALSVSLSTLGLNPNGTVEVPTDIQQPGWYGLGPSPGQDGSAVILGHVDSYTGPAVFFNLRSLSTGDLVDVSLADGATAEFKVTSVATYLKSAFPDQEVYGSHGYGALQLVSCSGVFDTHTGHYLSNIVVSTSLFATTPAIVGSPPT